MDLMTLQSGLRFRGLAQVSGGKRRKISIRFSSAVIWTAFGIAVMFGICMRTAVVDGASMSPTLKSGQHLLASKASIWLNGVNDGDIVLIKDWSSGDYVVKRVYRTAGQTVDQWSTPIDYPDATPFKPAYMVPLGSVYVLGDNRLASEDSRYYGPVPMDRIVAKVVLY